MSEIQITVSSRALERIIFIIIIIILLIFVIRGYVHDKNTNITGTTNPKVNSAAAVVNTTNATSTVQQPAASCSDGIKNQGEEGIDCGGPCPGYWYDNVCHTHAMQCRVASDCGASQKCQDYTCVALPPECITDSNCTANEQCTSGQCVAKPLTNRIDVTIDDITTTAPTSSDTSRVTQVKFTIKNGKANAVTLTADLYVYESITDDWATIKQDTYYFPSIASGGTFSQFVDINGKTFSDASNQKTLKVVFDNAEVGTLTKKFTAS